MSNDGTGLRDAELDARTIYDIACIRADASNATREDVEFKAIALRNYKAIAALTREAAPQANPHAQELTPQELSGEAERIAANLHKTGHGLAATVMRELVRRLATTDSAIQSQQGATGGAVDDAMVDRAMKAVSPDDSMDLEYLCDISDLSRNEARALVRAALTDALAHPQGEVYTFTEIEEAWGMALPRDKRFDEFRVALGMIHPQAAGSAPGEALHPAHTVEAAKRAFNIDSAGSVASGAVSGEFPAPIRNPEAWPERYADGYNDALQLVIDCGFATRPATAAGSAPVGVESDKRQGLPAQPYFWLASVLTTYGDKLSPSAMALITERLAATPAIDAALEKERAE